MLNSKFPILFAFHDVVKMAREQHPEIYEKWCAIDSLFAELRHDTNPHTRFHLDANVDLVLRLAEKEQAECFSELGKPLMGGQAFFQIALSKMWLLSTYELLRVTDEKSPCKGQISKGNHYCLRSDCLRCEVRQLKKTFNNYRTHLAKLETAKRDRQSPPMEQGIPDLVWDSDKGSIGWKSRDAKSETSIRASRLELSDLLLEKLGPSTS